VAGRNELASILDPCLYQLQEDTIPIVWPALLETSESLAAEGQLQRVRDGASPEVGHFAGFANFWAA